jgi:tRNA(Ile)-lysidine synthase
MPSLDERVYRTILRHGLIPPGARVLIALSGGADSTALACLLVDLASRGAFRVVGAAHLNHRLRGAASDGDEAFCRVLAGRLDLSFSSESADASALAASAGTSLEDAGRRARYDYLDRAARAASADRVAVGHTLDDQAETHLLQMLRGAGPRGLKAMAPSRPLGDVQVVRPLLDCRHDELVGWLASRGQAFREDDSNRDVSFVRNRLRHELLPLLRSRFSAGIEAVLARNAAIAAADAELLDQLAVAASNRLASIRGETVAVDCAALLAEPEATRRRVLLHLLGNLPGARFVGFNQVDRVLELAAGNRRGPLALPRAVAWVEGGRLLMEAVGPGARRRPSVPGQPGMNFWRCALSIPGEVLVPGTSWTVSSSLRSPGAAAGFEAVTSGRTEAFIDACRVAGLAVRTRRPGDWLRPLGLGGRKKLQDYFVDRKVPRDQRDRVPLVVDDRDRIVWVAGHGIDEEFRVGGGTRDVVILKLRGESA